MCSTFLKRNRNKNLIKVTTNEKLNSLSLNCGYANKLQQFVTAEEKMIIIEKSRDLKCITYDYRYDLCN